MAKIVKKTAAKAAPPKPQPKPAAPQPKAPPPKGQLPAVQAGGAVAPAFLAQRAADAQMGKSKAMEDNLVPMIAVVQSKSPPVDPDRPEKNIDGVEVGMFWLKGMDEFIDAHDGMLVQPCYFTKDWVEWKPNRQGFAGKHDQRPADAKEQTDPRDPNKKYWIRPNGNEVVETRYHVVRVWMDDGRKLAYTFPMTSTGHTTSKGWMFDMNNRGDGQGSEIASFALLYRLRTEPKSNAKGNWNAVTYEFEGYVESEEEYMAGLALCNAFEKGEKQMDDRLRDDDRGEPSNYDRM